MNKTFLLSYMFMIGCIYEAGGKRLCFLIRNMRVIVCPIPRIRDVQIIMV